MVCLTSFSTKNVIFVVYVVAFIGLTAVGIWDVKNIISDYIADNKFSLVKTRNSTDDRFRFVPKLRVCFENWPKFFTPTSRYMYFQNNMAHDSWNQKAVTWPNKTSPDERTLVSYLLEMNKFYAISMLDHLGSPAGGLVPTKFFKESNGSSVWVDASRTSSSVFSKLVESFVKDPKNVDLTKRAWVNATDVLLERGIFPPTTENYVDRYKESLTKMQAKPPSPIVLLDQTTASGFLLDGTFCNFCMSLPLSEHLMQFQGKMDYVFSMDQRAKGFGLRNIRLYAYDELFYERDTSNRNQSSRTDISIYNNGVIDTTQFPPCTSDFETENDCLLDIKESAIEEICQCTQFSVAWRKSFFRNDTSTFSSQRFCTAERYEQCWKKANAEVKRRQEAAKAAHTCKPCVFAKSSYVTTTTEEKMERVLYYNPLDGPVDWVRIICKDISAYLVFEERQQYSLSQLVSQVGGDLGLFIGFSMISFLQLILFFYHMFQKHRKTPFADGRSSNGRSKWFQFYMQYVLRSIIDEDEDESQQSLEGPVNNVRKLDKLQTNRTDRLGSLENKVDQLEKKFDVMDAKVDRLEKKLDAILARDASANNRRVAPISYAWYERPWIE